MSRAGCLRLDGAPSLCTGAVALPDAAPAASVEQWATYVDNQLGPRCVGQMFAGLGWIANRNQGKPASPRDIHVGALVRERARKTDPIDDTGVNANDAADSLVAIGAYSRDERDDDPNADTAMRTWPEAIRARLWKPSDLVPIDTGDTDTIRRVITAGYGVGICIQVDDSFEALRDGSTWGGMTGTVQGGHAMVVVGYDARGFRLWNSWGKDWGDGGFCWVGEFVLRPAWAMAMTGAPVLP